MSFLTFLFYSVKIIGLGGKAGDCPWQTWESCCNQEHLYNRRFTSNSLFDYISL